MRGVIFSQAGDAAVVAGVSHYGLRLCGTFDVRVAVGRRASNVHLAADAAPHLMPPRSGRVWERTVLAAITQEKP